MNKRQKNNLDLVSSIADDIIDKNTDKRIKLWGTRARRHFPKWIIPSGAAAAIFIAALIPILILLFSKQVPIYEGMTVLENFDGSTAKAAPSYRIDMLTSTDNNGNHYGHDKKPISDIVEEDPTISLTVPEQQMYYADPGQDIYINIHISNPDNFVILSFMLNGKMYSSYMFEEGSDMENIVLKVNVGDVAGVVEYTIDAIKYVDGTQIKDVIMEGDRTVKVGVYSEGIQPEASIVNELVGINEISFTAKLSDKYSLIERSGGKAYAILFGEDNIIAYKELSAGEAEITFDGLDTNTSYRYGIVAYYDSLDGNGLAAHVMLEKEFTTQSVVAIGDVKVNQTSIDFGVIFNEAFESKALSSMALYHGEEKVHEFDVSGDITQSTFSASELLSNNKYKLVLTYENLGKTETVEFELTTEAKATPEIEIVNPTKTQTSVGFEITEIDTDNVGAVAKIELVHTNGSVEAESLEAREFADLLSNNEYTVKVTYAYDLNDGVGEQTIVKELAIATEAKAEPTFTIKDVVADTYTVRGSYDQTNVDNTLISYKVELYKGDELVNENENKEINFDFLNYYTDYTVKITYTFDVNDGKGVQEKIVEQTAKTLPYFDVTSVSVLDKKDVYLDGDKATVRINVDNPLAARVASVIIDGVAYKTNASSTTRIVLVDIEDMGKLGNGKIEGFTVNIDGVEYNVTDISEAKLDVLVLGTVDITSWEIVDENFERIEYATLSDKVYVVISADKLAGNTITSITLSHGQSHSVEWHDTDPSPAFTIEYGADEIKMLDDGRFYVELKADGSKGYHFNTVSATYKNDYIESAESTNNTFYQHPFIMLNSDEVRTVSSIEELLNMENGYRYELTCDLDFAADETWQSRGFSGILDGKGYAIQNFLLFAGEGSGDPDGDRKDSGFFTHLDGIIENLNFESFVYSEDSVDGSFYATGVIGMATRSSIIRNCTLDETSEIVTTRTSYTGGICGESQGLIENCTNHAIIRSVNIVGGICGHSTGTIRNCNNYGSINDTFGSAPQYMGGICGKSSGIVQSCINHGDISSYGYNISGIANANWNVSGVYVEDCDNYGEITALGKSDENYPFAITNNGQMKNCNNYGTIRHNTTFAGDTHKDTAEVTYVILNTSENCHNYGAIYVGGNLIVEAKEPPQE